MKQLIRVSGGVGRSEILQDRVDSVADPALAWHPTDVLTDYNFMRLIIQGGLRRQVQGSAGPVSEVRTLYVPACHSSPVVRLSRSDGCDSVISASTAITHKSYLLTSVDA